MNIEIPAELAHKLEQIAATNQLSIHELIALLLRPYETIPIPPDSTDIPPVGTAARMVYEAQRANFHSTQTDTSERSREILANELSEDIWRRTHGDE